MVGVATVLMPIVLRLFAPTGASFKSSRLSVIVVPVPAVRAGVAGKLPGVTPTPRLIVPVLPVPVVIFLLTFRLPALSTVTFEPAKIAVSAASPVANAPLPRSIAFVST